MSHLKCISLFFLILASLAATQPTVASEVTYYPGVPGLEPPWAFYTFDFTGFPPGMGTGFSETLGHLTITYTSTDDPYAFRTVNSGDLPTEASPSPVLLSERGSSVLGISFSHPVFGIGVDYVTLGPGPIQMDIMSGGLGGSVVGTLRESGSIPAGLVYPEGFISLLPLCVCDNYFDAVVLSDSTDPRFAVRRLIVLENLPEPPTLALFGIGFSLLATLRKRKCV